MKTPGGRYSSRAAGGITGLIGGLLLLVCLIQGCGSDRPGEHPYTADLAIQVIEVTQNEPGDRFGPPVVPDPVGRRPTEVRIVITNNGDRDIARLSCAVTCSMMGVGHGQTKRVQPVSASGAPLKKKGGTRHFTVTFSETIEHVSPAARIGMAEISVEVTDIGFAD